MSQLWYTYADIKTNHIQITLLIGHGLHDIRIYIYIYILYILYNIVLHIYTTIYCIVLYRPIESKVSDRPPSDTGRTKYAPVL